MAIKVHHTIFSFSHATHRLAPLGIFTLIVYLIERWLHNGIGNPSNAIDNPSNAIDNPTKSHFTTTSNDVKTENLRILF